MVEIASITLWTIFLVATSIAPARAAERRTEWESTVEAAKKEGQLVIYASDDYETIFQTFHKRYPEIKVVAVTGRGSQTAQRVISERRGGKYLADLYLGGSGTAYNIFYEAKILDPVKPLLVLPEVLDLSKWWRGKRVYHDDAEGYILAFNGEVQSYFGYNTKLVNPDDFQSYWDFLEPKWKGKIVSYDPTMGGAVSGVLLFLYNNPRLGPGFIRRFLTETELTTSRDSRQIVDWLAVGKFSLTALGGRRMGLDEAARQGLPVSFFNSKLFQEGAPLSTSNGNVALFNRAAHPNAAKVALNWLLSREGQTAYQKVIPEADSLRIDVPKDHIPLPKRREDDGDYLVLAGPGFKDTDVVQKIVDEVWKKRGR